MGKSLVYVAVCGCCPLWQSDCPKFTLQCHGLDIIYLLISLNSSALLSNMTWQWGHYCFCKPFILTLIIFLVLTTCKTSIQPSINLAKPHFDEEKKRRKVWLSASILSSFTVYLEHSLLTMPRSSTIWHSHLNPAYFYKSRIFQHRKSIDMILFSKGFTEYISRKSICRVELRLSYRPVANTHSLNLQITIHNR